MTDFGNRLLGQEPVEPEEPLGSHADRVERPQDDTRPTAVPESIKRKMKLLESGKSSTWWRVGKNLGAAMVGAGTALLLASNPVGWGVTACLIGVGAVAALTGTFMTLRADFAAVDVAAFKASLESGGPVRETATLKTKAGIFALNVLESGAFAAAGYFGVAGIGAAYGASAFHGVVASGQSIGHKLATEVALPAIYGGGSILASAPGSMSIIGATGPIPISSTRSTSARGWASTAARTSTMCRSRYRPTSFTRKAGRSQRTTRRSARRSPSKARWCAILWRPTIRRSHAQHGNSPVFFVATDEAGDLFDTLAFCNRGVHD